MKLVILDRDGVINYDSDQYIKSPDEWKPIPGSLEAIARLTQGDWQVVVATNQSGIERGLFDVATLNAIHAEMHRAVNQAGGRIDVFQGAGDGRFITGAVTNRYLVDIAERVPDHVWK